LTTGRAEKLASFVSAAVHFVRHIRTPSFSDSEVNSLSGQRAFAHQINVLTELIEVFNGNE
jgi:hypothetical protein